MQGKKPTAKVKDLETKKNPKGGSNPPPSGVQTKLTGIISES